MNQLVFKHRVKGVQELYGESFAEAMVKAEQIVAMSNGRIRNTKASITRIADDIVKANLINNGVVSAAQYSAAFDAAYFAAGRAIGHEANNPLSIGIKKLTEGFTEAYKQQLLHGNYNRAAMFLLFDIMASRILNKFIGGAANWLAIGLKRNGAGLVTAFTDGKRKVDLSEVTEEDLKKELIAWDNFHSDMWTGFIGGFTTLLVFLLTSVDFDDDDPEKGTFTQWIQDNPWAKKFAYVALPLAYSAYLYKQDDKMDKWWLRTFFLEEGQFKANVVTGFFTGKGKYQQKLTPEEIQGIRGKAISGVSTLPGFGVYLFFIKDYGLIEVF